MSPQAAQCRGCHFLNGRLLPALFARDDHIRLEQHAFETYPLLKQSIERFLEYATRHLFAAPDRVRSLHKDFRFYDGHKVLLLTERRIASKRVCIHLDTGPTWKRIRYANDSPPLGEARAHLMVRRKAVA